MSDLNVDTIGDRLGNVEVPTATVVAGSAKAWVNFNGTGTVAIRDSFNVDSITDNGTGNYTVNFTNAMPDTNYVVTGMSEANIGLGDGRVNMGADTKTTSAFTMYGRAGSTTLHDMDLMQAAVFSN